MAILWEFDLKNNIQSSDILLIKIFRVLLSDLKL